MKKEDKVKELFEICGGTAKDVAKVLGMPIATARNMTRTPPQVLPEYVMNALIDRARTINITILCEICGSSPIVNSVGSCICEKCNHGSFEITENKAK